MDMLEEEFWEWVDIRGDDDCWEWKRSRFPDGYGQVNHTVAHRIAWEMTNGPIPEGLWVLHKCDNPPCCNPNHLFLGTVKDNVHDAMRKGRMLNEERRKHIAKCRRECVTSDEARKNMSLVQIGNKNALGWHHTNTTREKMSSSHKGKVSPHKGMHMSDEAKKKISIANKGRIPPNKGKQHAEETRRKMSVARRRWLDQEFELRGEQAQHSVGKDEREELEYVALGKTPAHILGKPRYFESDGTTFDFTLCGKAIDPRWSDVTFDVRTNM
jgi:hypothetical protein